MLHMTEMTTLVQFHTIADYWPLSWKITLALLTLTHLLKKDTKPYPLDLPVAMSLTTRQSLWTKEIQFTIL